MEFIPLKITIKHTENKNLKENDEINKIHINDAVRYRPDDQLY